MLHIASSKLQIAGPAHNPVTSLVRHGLHDDIKDYGELGRYSKKRTYTATHADLSDHVASARLQEGRRLLKHQRISGPHSRES
jgi:hypothetical protein